MFLKVSKESYMKLSSNQSVACSLAQRAKLLDWKERAWDAFFSSVRCHYDQFRDRIRQTKQKKASIPESFSDLKRRSLDLTHYGRRLHWVIRSIRSNALFRRREDLGFSASVIYLIWEFETYLLLKKSLIKQTPLRCSCLCHQLFRSILPWRKI